MKQLVIATDEVNRITKKMLSVTDPELRAALGQALADAKERVQKAEQAVALASGSANGGTGGDQSGAFNSTGSTGTGGIVAAMVALAVVVVAAFFIVRHKKRAQEHGKTTVVQSFNNPMYETNVYDNDGAVVDATYDVLPADGIEEMEGDASFYQDVAAEPGVAGIINPLYVDDLAGGADGEDTYSGFGDVTLDASDPSGYMDVTASVAAEGATYLDVVPVTAPDGIDGGAEADDLPVDEFGGADHFGYMDVTPSADEYLDVGVGDATDTVDGSGAR
jgi:hypothetical protein